jgi:UDP-glucuronate 4-epimerase
VFASSSSVYGARAQVPFREDDRVDDPVSPYAATKTRGRADRATRTTTSSPCRSSCLRFFTVYGPRQRPEMAIATCSHARRCSRAQPIPFFGDGSHAAATTRTSTTASRAWSPSIDRAVSREGYRIYNLGCSATTTLAELVAHLERATGKKAIIDRRPDQPGDVPLTFADVSRAEAELGYAPTTPVAVGIPRFVEWLERRLRG